MEGGWAPGSRCGAHRAGSGWLIRKGTPQRSRSRATNLPGGQRVWTQVTGMAAGGLPSTSARTTSTVTAVLRWQTGEQKSSGILINRI